MEPFFAQGRIDVIDHPTLLRELKTLERRPRAGGRVMVDHPHGGHDDYPNALALAASGAGSLVGATVNIEPTEEEWAQLRGLRDLLPPWPLFDPDPNVVEERYEGEL